MSEEDRSSIKKGNRDFIPKDFESTSFLSENGAKRTIGIRSLLCPQVRTRGLFQSGLIFFLGHGKVDPGLSMILQKLNKVRKSKGKTILLLCYHSFLLFFLPTF